MTYSTAFRRLLAFAIDCIAMLGLYMLISLTLGLSFIFSPIASLPMFGLWFYGGIFALAWLYYALQESSSHQATLGKRIMHIKVVDLKGERIGFWRATARYFGKMVSRFIFMIGFLMIPFTKKKQALHDKMARCLVIYRPSA